MHRNSILLFQKYIAPRFTPGARVLEIGPDAFPSTFRQLVPQKDITWDTMDIYESPKLTYSKSSPYNFPIPDNTYDFVFAAQVLEHVEKIWKWMPEVARVAKPGGIVCLINPVSWPYHEAPVDCWRIYPTGMKALCEDSGLDIELCRFESLEIPRYKNSIPGRSPGIQPRPLAVFFRVAGLFGFPVEKAFDTVTLARKKI
jgi:SAM-dependent methyltransferase